MKSNFLEPEMLSGYYVDAKMKCIWQCELSLLEKFIEVCHKHNLRYYMAGGSLLGVIRHGGFIPWDDDIDIDMPRSDYNKLLEIANNEFTGDIFFQTTYTDDNYVRPHAQIRHSLTTAIVEHEKGLSFNQGIFIDIFPLDAAPSNKFIRFFHSKLIKLLSVILKAGIMINPKKNTSKMKCLAHYLVIPLFKVTDYKKVFGFFEKVCSFYNSDPLLPVGEISFDYSSKCIWPSECFNDVVIKNFEGIKVACPIGYDQILEISFGDYMTPQQSPSYHGSIIFDTQLPYTEYLHRE